MTVSLLLNFCNNSWFTSLTLTQAYALAFYRLPETLALQRCLLTSPSNTGLWGIITMAKPLWTYTVVKTLVMSPSEWCIFSLTNCILLRPELFAGTSQFVWRSYLGKVLMPRVRLEIHQRVRKLSPLPDNHTMIEALTPGTGVQVSSFCSARCLNVRILHPRQAFWPPNYQLFWRSASSVFPVGPVSLCINN